MVDLSSNAIRALARAGHLTLYFSGRSCWFSRSELEAAIRAGIPSRRATETEAA